MHHKVRTVIWLCTAGFGLVCIAIAIAATAECVCNYFPELDNLSAKFIRELAYLRIAAAFTGVFLVMVSIGNLVVPGWIYSLFNDNMKARLQEPHYYISFCIIMALCTLTVGLIATWDGPALSADSVGYIQAARDIAAGEGFGNFSHYPLFPLLIAGLILLGFDPITAAGLIPVFSFVLLIPLMFSLCKIAGNVFIGYASSIGCLLFTPMIFLARYAWTDMPFIIASLAIVILLIRFSRTNSLKLLCIAGLIIGIGLLLRYSIAFLIPVGIVAVVAANYKRINALIIRGIIFCSLSCIPVIPWLYHNYITVSRLSMGYHPSEKGALKGIIDYAQFFVITFAQDFFPLIFRVPGEKYILTFLIIVLFILLVAYLLYYPNNRLTVLMYIKQHYLILLSLAGYIASILMSAALWFLYYEVRFVRAIYPVFIIALLLFIYYLYKGIRSNYIKIHLFSAVAVVWALLLIIQAIYAVEYLGRTADTMQYNSTYWRNSESISWLNSNLPSEALVFSNNRLGIALRIENETRWVPAVGQNKAIEDFLLQLSASDTVYIVGFKEQYHQGRIKVMTNDEITEAVSVYFTLSPVADFPEATIWHVLPAER